MDIHEFTKTLNKWGHDKVPFLFVVDFEMNKPIAIPLNRVNPDEWLYSFNGVTNLASGNLMAKPAEGEEIIKSNPMPFDQYEDKFDSVMRHLEYGDSYLANLTIATEIELQHSLKELFQLTNAKYKLLHGDNFLVFSPETFVQIKEGKIYSYPMKGTIDASIPEAEQKILSDKKELAEHVTIVDLIRNDLSKVANNVNVNRFRYVEEVRTHHKTLLQVSSEIVGELSDDYSSHLGDILVNLLPAGSISGAPKTKTLEILRNAEQLARGYYTGVVGYFDGESLDSGVMIRYIEKKGSSYAYRSGGGLTTQSTAHSEYEEALNKIYVPIT